MARRVSLLYVGLTWPRPGMEFRILGPLEVLAEGQVVRLGGGKQRAVLALSVLHANEALSIDR